MLVDLAITGTSAATQLVAVILALRLGRQTRRLVPWSLFALAILLMVARSGMALHRMATEPLLVPDRFAEATFLGISAVVLAGLIWVETLFRTIRERGERASGLGRILEDSRNEIYLFDADTLRFVQANRGARENLGYDMEELRQLTPLDVKPEFTRESLEELIGPLRRGESERIHFETVHLRRDGSTYRVEVHMQLSSASGSPVFVAIISDVSERRLAEEGLQRLQMATEQAGEGITVLDQAGQIVYANPAFA